MRFGSLAVAWSEFIRSASPGKISLFYILIRRDARLVGVGVLHVVHAMDLGKFIDPRLGTLVRYAARVGLHPLSFNVGFLEVPLMNFSGILLIPEVEHARDAIRAQIIGELRGTLGMECLLVKSDPATMGPETAPLGLLRVPAPQNAVLALEEDSYQRYLHRFRRNRRRSFIKARRQLVNYGATLETLDTIDDCWQQLYRLFSLATRQAKQTDKLPLPIELDEAFFRRLNMLDASNFQITVVRYQRAIVAFSLTLNDGSVRFAKYFGADYQHSLASHAYFNLSTYQIERAIAAGCATFDFGTSNYAYKERMGCTLEPREYLVDVYHPVLRPLANLVSKRVARVERAEQSQRAV